jgi:uncharacterized protein YecE (DUF72 family)
MATSNVLVGTASWTDPTLIKCKCFYPDDAKTPEERLRFYASQFPVVEVDSSFYSLPTFNNSVLWAQRTPPEFVFDIKLFRAFTMHQTPLKALPGDLRDEAGAAATKTGNVYYKDLSEELQDALWRKFEEGIAPLKSAGKLGYLLFQLPPWAAKNHDNVAHLERALQRLDDYTVAVEFRNATWLSERSRASTVSMLRELNVPMVIVDEPQDFPSSMPLVWEATSSELAVVRFHGHNHETWMKKGLASSAERFNYLYTPDELQGFVKPIHNLATNTKRVHAMMNNCYRNNAQVNAQQLREQLGLV